MIKNRFMIGATLIISLSAGILIYLLLSRLDPQQHTVLAEVKERGELRIVTRNAPTTWYEKHNGQFAGIEYDMALAFAEHLGVKPRFIIKETIEDILTSLSSGEADIAAAGLTITDSRETEFRFGPSYQSVKQQVICRRDAKQQPRAIEALDSQQLHVAARTSYAERLTELQQDYPQLNWRQHDEHDTEYLLRRVWLRKLDCTVADTNIFAVNQRYYPELAVMFDLSDDTPLAWAMRNNAGLLQAAVENWFSGFKESGKLTVLLDRYYGHLDSFDYVDTQKFRKRITSRLPRYRKWFKQAAKKYRIDWRLLAALSYQESHWNPRAKSPTGVRGIMMLTQPTARQLGVKSRLDPEASIFAGARYLAQIRRRLPKSIKEPERTWMALAAYNFGFGHLMDGMQLAEQLGKDPQVWVELEEVLPLLSQQRYYRTLKHGYARGGEAVYYVKQIRDYRDILTEVTRNQKSKR
ncbi:MAG: membrane-bound lytic murein transglycosylase MltF [Gammaproteobacteria bacterium]|nr:membrane-bound lytic murein transglycosylase MltF [Gammaproteobacteria bacterium]MDH5652555.1 membrane-bound lytic murein transglycosylase MltF [Gammaproteobacteria bacterium]